MLADDHTHEQRDILIGAVDFDETQRDMLTLEDWIYSEASSQSTPAHQGNRF